MKNKSNKSNKSNKAPLIDQRKSEEYALLDPKTIQDLFDTALDMENSCKTSHSRNKSTASGDTTEDPSSYQEGGDHYKRMKIQPWDVVDTWPLQQRIGAYRFSALKYIMRLGEKDNLLVEAKKSKHCCHKLQDTIEIGETTGE